MVTRAEREDFRILWHSVSGHIRSGYGNVTRQVTSRLKDAGFNIFVSAYYGIEPGGVLVINNVPTLPSKAGRFGETACLHYYKSLKANCGVLMSDPWAFDWFPARIPCSVCHGPFDHESYPIEIQNMVRGYTYRVSISKWQKDEWAKYDPPIVWDPVIPHGVDTKIFYPINKNEAKKAMGLPEDIFLFGTVAANCYDECTEVLTKMGWKFFKNVSYTDEVATLNKENMIEYQNPTNIISQDYNGKMYYIHNKCIDLLVTPNHRMYVKRKEYDSSRRRSVLGTTYRMEESSTIFGKQRWYKKNGTWIGKDIDYFILPEYIPKPKSSIKEYLSISIPMETWLEFFGYYISEGHSDGYRVSIKQSKKKHPEKFKIIKECLDKLPFKYSISKREMEFEISNVQLASYLKQFGSSLEKYIPMEIKELSSFLLNIFLDAAMLGDGNKRMSNNVWTYSTSSIKLRDDIQEIALKVGYAGDYVLVPEHDQYSIISNKMIHVKDHWIITIKRKQLEPRNRQAWTHLSKDFREEWQEYNGIVYCLTVPNHILYVRRNGKTCWSGNSDKESRKSHGEHFEALKLFLQNNPDVKRDTIKYFVFTNPIDPRGLNLELFAMKQKVRDIVMLQDPMVFETGIKDQELSLIYNAFDVLLAASRREGFNIPLLEAQACGTPAIIHNFSAPPELVRGHGWMCKSKMKTYSPINAITAMPDVEDLAKQIEDAYFHPELREKYGQEAAKFAKDYDWDKLVSQQWIPFFDNIIEESKPKTFTDRKLA